jgi:hypothetical protein
MLRVYAAWTADSLEEDALAIRQAMGYVNRMPTDAPEASSFRRHLAVDLPVAGSRIELSTGKDQENVGGEGGIRTRREGEPDQ